MIEACPTIKGVLLFEPGVWSLELTCGAQPAFDGNVESDCIMHDSTGSFRAFAESFGDEDSSWYAEHLIVYILGLDEEEMLEDDDMVLCIDGADAGKWEGKTLIDPSLIEEAGPDVPVDCRYISSEALREAFYRYDGFVLGDNLIMLIALDD